MAPGGSRLPNGFTAYLKVSVNMDIAQMFPPEKVEQMGVSIMRHWSYLPANAVKDQYRLGSLWRWLNTRAGSTGSDRSS